MLMDPRDYADMLDEQEEAAAWEEGFIESPEDWILEPVQGVSEADRWPYDPAIHPF